MTLEETLTDWQRTEDEIRRRLAGKVGVARPEQVLGKTGMEVLSAMMLGELPYSHISDTMDFLLVEVAPGKAVFQGWPQVKHLNPMGGVHGGWYATLLDSALGCAVHTLMPVGRGYTTAEVSINIVRAATPQSGPLRAVGTVLHSGRQLATAEGKIVGPDGKLYAHATTTCLVFDLR